MPDSAGRKPYSRMHPSVLFILRDYRQERLRQGEPDVETVSDAFNLIAVTEGEGQASTSGLTYRLAANSLFLARPGESIALKAQSASFAYHRLCFSMLPVPSWEGVNSDTATALQLPTGLLACSPFSRCLELFEALGRNPEEGGEEQLFHNHVRFEELLRLLLEQNRTRSDESAFTDIRQAVLHTIESLKEHYSDTITVGQLAAKANVHPWQFSRTFKEITGQIPLEYVNGLRIDRAKKLLVETEDRIHEIASQVGFGNEFYFNRKFKQSVGVAPGRYRSRTRSHPRVMALFMEDGLLSLGITPVVQWSHPAWGKQEHLGMSRIPTFDVLKDNPGALARYEPDLIVTGTAPESLGAHPAEQFERIARTHAITYRTKDWRSVLRMLGSLLDKEEQAEQVLRRYEEELSAVRHRLSPSLKNRTYACLRVSADGICVDQEYSTPFLNGDLGIEPHPMVRELSYEAGRDGVGREWLAELDADYLFYTFDTWHAAEAGVERGQLLQPAWSSIPSVRSGRAFEVDFMVWMNNGYIANGRKLNDLTRIVEGRGR